MPGLTPGRGSRFLSSPKRLDHKRAHVASHAMSTGCSFLQGKSDLGVKIAIYIHLLPRLRMRGDVPLLLLFAFITRTGTTSYLRKLSSRNRLPFFFSLVSIPAYLLESDQAFTVSPTVFGILNRKQTSKNTVHQQNDVT